MTSQELVDRMRRGFFATVMDDLRSRPSLDAARLALEMIEWMDSPSEIGHFRRMLTLWADQEKT